jgi:hypothetical protein
MIVKWNEIMPLGQVITSKSIVHHLFHFSLKKQIDTYESKAR